MSISPPLPTERSFGITFTIVFGAVCGWLAWTEHTTWAVATAVASGLTLIVSLTRPVLLRPLNRAWMKFGAILHSIVSPAVLGAIFFLIMAPVGVFMRLRGRDELKLRREPGARSYWVHRTPPGPAPDSLNRQF